MTNVHGARSSGSTQLHDASYTLIIVLEAIISVFGCSADNSDVDIIKLKHIILGHQPKVITSKDDEDVQRIYVCRSHIFSDSL